MKFGSVVGLDRSVSRLVLGTMIVTTQDLEGSFALLDQFVALGGNALDTAHVYAGGASERAIGQWMQARQNRDKVVIISKGAHHNADRRRVTPWDITSDLYDSLARLQTDSIDVYLLHRDDPSLPVGPIVEVLNEHHQAGRIHAFGGSNWHHTRIAEANTYAQQHGLVGFTASSPHFSLAEQVEDPWGPGCVAISGPQEEDARRFYATSQIAVFAYSSLARGFFSGRISEERFADIKDTIDPACRRAYCHPQNFQRLRQATSLAETKRLTVAQIALAYVFNQSLNVFALVGATNPEELQSSAAATDITLSEGELAMLEG